MKKITIIILLLTYFSTAHCQVFKGTVYDRSTDSTLSYAIIYISGTSIGMYSDLHGNFELDISKFSSLPITISLFGYHSITLHKHAGNIMNNIYLTPKIMELKEVIVTAYGRGNRDEYLKIFKREFFGETQNSIRFYTE